jgi:predicted nucleic acid binding AN1-type Zn finger protein
VPVEVIIREETIEEPEIEEEPKIIIVPVKEEPQKKIPSRCETCHREFTGWSDTFCCKYCGKYSCTEHLLPESHNCPNPDSPFNRWGRK